MTPERHEQIANLYDEALEIPPSQRAGFLDKACAGDAMLRREVESLLALEEQAEDFIETPALNLAAELIVKESPPLPSGGMVGFYQVLSSLGAGGMGEVYLAEDTRLGRKIALKLLPANFSNEAARLRRFEQEARTASALNHPNIITIHDIGQVEGRPFIATEFISGETLRQRMIREPMKVDEAVDVAIQAANALAAAHAAGVVHRDIKPENIMLRTDGYVKVLDFGLAKLTQSAEPDDVSPDALLAAESLTTTSLFAGTVKYMSPEQAMGQKVDARSDIFSFGVVLYEMLAGKLPFAHETRDEVIAAIVSKEPAVDHDLPMIPEALKQIVVRSMRKSRDERYQKAEDLLADLKAFQHASETRHTANRKRQRWPAVLAIAAVVLLGAAGLLYYRTPVHRGTRNAKAERLVLQGRIEWDQVSEERLQKSKDLFLQAKELDPNYSLAYAGLADVYSLLGEISAMRPLEAFSHAKVYATQALDLDPTLDQAWVSLGIGKLLYDWDWNGAKEAFDRAKKLNPKNPHAYHFYGHYLQFLGRTDEAIQETKHGVELAPDFLLIDAELGWAYYAAHDYETAIEHERKILARDKDFAYASWVMVQALEQQGKYREAFEVLNQVSASDWAWIVADIGYVHAKSGRRAEALKIIADLQERSKGVYIDPVLIAYIYIALDNKDEAFAWLTKGVQEHAALIPWLKIEPKFDDLRGDARFTDLMRRVGLP